MTAGIVAARPAMGAFERNLSWWVSGCIAAGILLGQLFPMLFRVAGELQVARVNLPMAVLIWLMIVPMLLKVDFGALHRLRRHARGIGVTLFINWAVKPFSMAFLGWLFVRHVFEAWLPAGQIDSYIAGLILLAAAPCTAMVFVWSDLSDGDANFTLSQVALNDAIMVFAFAPLVGLLLGLSASGIAVRVADDARIAVRIPGTADTRRAPYHRHAGGTHSHPGVLQFGSRVLAQPDTRGRP